MCLCKVMSKKLGSGVEIRYRVKAFKVFYNLEIHDSLPPSSELNKFEVDKPAFECCAIGCREGWAFYSYLVCYASLRLSMANNGRKLKHVTKNHCINKTVSTAKSSIEPLKMNFFTNSSSSVFKTHLYIT